MERWEMVYLITLGSFIALVPILLTYAIWLLVT